MEVVDAHQHLGSLSNAMGHYGGREVEVSLEDDSRTRAEGLEAVGIDWAVIQPSHGYLKPEGIKDTMRLNDSMAQYRKLSPTRFPVVLGTVEPMHGERSLEEVDRAKSELGLNGLSWHHRFQGCYIDNKWMRPILSRMADLKLVPFIHTNAESAMEAPWRLQQLALEFPGTTFLAMDAFFTLEKSLEVLNTAQHTPNIIWDFGGASGHVSIEVWVAKNGSESVTFSGGSTYAGRRARRPALLDTVLKSSRLTDDDKANILGRNVRRLFGMSLEPGAVHE